MSIVIWLHQCFPTPSRIVISTEREKSKRDPSFGQSVHAGKELLHP